MGEHSDLCQEYEAEQIFTKRGGNDQGTGGRVELALAFERDKCDAGAGGREAGSYSQSFSGCQAQSKAGNHEAEGASAKEYAGDAGEDGSRAHV